MELQVYVCLPSTGVCFLYCKIVRYPRLIFKSLHSKSCLTSYDLQVVLLMLDKNQSLFFSFFFVIFPVISFLVCQEKNNKAPVFSNHFEPLWDVILDFNLVNGRSETALFIHLQVNTVLMMNIVYLPTFHTGVLERILIGVQIDYHSETG